MNDDQEDDTIILSPLSRTVEEDGFKVSVEIYQNEGDTGWYLEVVDEENNSTAWDDVFASEQEALEEALDTIKEEGIRCLIAAESWGES